MTKNKVDIYIITDLLNGKHYVGQTVKGYKFRYEQHCAYALNKRKDYSQLIDLIIKNKGIENFKCELLEQVNFEDKDKKEIYYINKYDTYKNGYNCTIGGDYNPMFENSIKEKHDSIMRSDEIRTKISKSVKKAYTKELRKWFSEQSKLKWVNFNQDKKDRILEGLKVYNESKKQSIACLNENDEIVRKFNSASEACIYFNKPIKEAGHIIKVCDKYNKSGKRAKHFGYSWKKL